MTSQALPTRRQAVLVCVCAALTALMCAGLLGAAALVPAPPAVLPFLVVICIGGPMAAACELPSAIARLRGARDGADRGSGRRRGLDTRALDTQALETLRRQLDELPEAEHPLGL
jgi:hypothetical protein